MKKILITGGTGFLGKHLAKALKSKGCEVTLGARNNKQNRMVESILDCEVLPMDVTSIESIRDGVSYCKPDTIIHAGATKFVDLSEKHPNECIDVNIGGSQNIARVAIDKGIETVLGISTDKAAPPIKNIYGLSKSVMEKLFLSLNNKYDTNFSCVRYGNVAWSTGSVLTIWKKMIEETNIIKTSGWYMRRFFFTVFEAVALVQTALSNMDQVAGKILSREMKSAKMVDFINVWVEKTGGSWEKTEGRPGDRLDEFLIGEIEHEYTYRKEFDGIIHYIINHNEKIDNCITDEVSSKTAIHLSKEEILNIIENPPEIL